MNGAEETHISHFSTGESMIYATIKMPKQFKVLLSIIRCVGWILEMEKWLILMNAQDQDFVKNASTILDL